MADRASADLLARIRLLRTPNIGPVSYRHLLRRFGSAEQALAALPDLVQARGGKAPRLCSIGQAEAEIQAVRKIGARYLCHDDPAYPRLLGLIDTAPPVLMAWGHVDVLEKPAVALVGARNASASACRFAREMAADLVEAGCLVVSGLARGIDTAAHRGALHVSGSGKAATVGVIASGIDIAYPPENQALQQEMAERALVLAEQPPGAEPLARHFPYRNRIIAGLCLATVVVEAAPRSGSLITARLAAEAGRDVMAVPGSPLDSRSRGCNDLIRSGATLVEGAEDVLEQLRPMGTDAGPAEQALADGGRGFLFGDDSSDFVMEEPGEDQISTVRGLLGFTAVSVDELIRQSGLPTTSVQTILAELELAGQIERHAAGRVSLSETVG